MEITDREDVGVDLRAPQRNIDGQEPWHWTLVSYARPGDIVFHWQQSGGESTLVGWSEVVGPLYVDSRGWQVRNPRTRAEAKLEDLPHWIMPLGGMHPLARPLSRADLMTRLADVRSALDTARAGNKGAVYPPYVMYGGQRLQAMEAYLTKLPAALVPIIEDLAGQLIAEPSEQPSPEDSKPSKRPSRRAGQGRLQDPVLRRAVELYAVDRAKAYYREKGARKIEVLGKPYDLKLRLGRTERHVEVKGTTIDGAVSVVLTVGEVVHAQVWPHTDLFVVDSIAYIVEGDGHKLSGGVDHIRSDWAPAEDALHPTQFSYELPSWDED